MDRSIFNGPKEDTSESILKEGNKPTVMQESYDKQGSTAYNKNTDKSKSNTQNNEKKYR